MSVKTYNSKNNATQPTKTTLLCRGKFCFWKCRPVDFLSEHVLGENYQLSYGTGSSVVSRNLKSSTFQARRNGESSALIPDHGSRLVLDDFGANTFRIRTLSHGGPLQRNLGICTCDFRGNLFSGRVWKIRIQNGFSCHCRNGD